MKDSMKTVRIVLVSAFLLAVGNNYTMEQTWSGVKDQAKEVAVNAGLLAAQAVKESRIGKAVIAHPIAAIVAASAVGGALVGVKVSSWAHQIQQWWDRKNGEEKKAIRGALVVTTMVGVHVGIIVAAAQL